MVPYLPIAHTFVPIKKFPHSHLVCLLQLILWLHISLPYYGTHKSFRSLFLSAIAFYGSHTTLNMTIHRQTQLHGLAVTHSPNSLLAHRLASVLQQRRVQGAHQLLCAPRDLTASQSAPDLQALIQSALQVFNDETIMDTAQQTSNDDEPSPSSTPKGTSP